jgi:hypothetical protein
VGRVVRVEGWVYGIGSGEERRSFVSLFALFLVGLKEMNESMLLLSLLSAVRCARRLSMHRLVASLSALHIFSFPFLHFAHKLSSLFSPSLFSEYKSNIQS